MSFKSSSYLIEGYEAPEITELQTQITTNTSNISTNTTAISANSSAITTLTNRLGYDELDIQLAVNKSSAIGYNVNIPVSSFPPTVGLGNAGNWFGLDPVVTLQYSGLYQITAYFTTTWNSTTQGGLSLVGTGMNLFNGATQLQTVLGTSCIVSSWRPDNWTGAGVQLTMICDLQKLTPYTIALFLNYGVGLNISFAIGFVGNDNNQWDRPQLNRGYSGINFTLLKPS
jgi:hypothetical protein